MKYNILAGKRGGWEDQGIRGGGGGREDGGKR